MKFRGSRGCRSSLEAGQCRIVPPYFFAFGRLRVCGKLSIFGKLARPGLQRRCKQETSRLWLRARKYNYLQLAITYDQASGVTTRIVRLRVCLFLIRPRLCDDCALTAKSSVDGFYAWIFASLTSDTVAIGIQPSARTETHAGEFRQNKGPPK